MFSPDNNFILDKDFLERTELSQTLLQDCMRRMLSDYDRDKDQAIMDYFKHTYPDSPLSDLWIKREEFFHEVTPTGGNIYHNGLLIIVYNDRTLQVLNVWKGE